MYQISCRAVGPSSVSATKFDRIKGFFPSLVYELLLYGFGPRRFIHAIRRSAFNPNGDWYGIHIELDEQTPEGSKTIKDYGNLLKVFNEKTPFSESALETLARDIVKTKEGYPSGRLSLDEEPVFKVEYFSVNP